MTRSPHSTQLSPAFDGTPRPPDGSRHHRPLGRLVAVALLLAASHLALFGAAPARAQRYGQWWWQASVQLEQREAEDVRDEKLLHRFTRDGLRLDTTLNGFIIHPNFGSFKLRLDLLFSSYEGYRFDDQSNLGGEVDVRLFQRGRYPLRLFVKRRTFDYTLPPGSPPRALERDAAADETWGGSFRVKGGFLKGLQVNVDSSTVTFVEPDIEPSYQENQQVSWDRSAGRTRHRLRLSRNWYSLGVVDLDREHMAAFLDESGAFGENWKWAANTTVIRQDLRLQGVDREIDDLRVFGKVHRPYRDHDRLELETVVDVTDSSIIGMTSRYSLTARYRWQRRPGFQLSPFLRYDHQTSELETTTSPRIGAAVTWSKAKGSFDSVVTANASVGNTDSDTSGGASNLSATLSATLRHGKASRLRKQLEVTLSRNELSSRLEDTSPDSPDLGLTRTVGSQDLSRFRLRVIRQLSRSSAELAGEWSRNAATDAIFGGEFTADTTSASVTWNRRRMSISANTGETAVDRPLLADQDVTFFVGFFSLKPWRSLHLQASYRQDQQTSILNPDLDTESLEIKASFRFALLELEGRLYDIERTLEGAAPRANRGFSWTIRRRFSGGLPIFSVKERRGVIR